VNTTRLSQARRLFSSPYVSAAQNRANAVKWARQIRMLGPKWVGLVQTAKEAK
jgi:hypothetical protein